MKKENKKETTAKRFTRGVVASDGRNKVTGNFQQRVLNNKTTTCLPLPWFLSNTTPPHLHGEGKRYHHDYLNLLTVSPRSPHYRTSVTFSIIAVINKLECSCFPPARIYGPWSVFLRLHTIVFSRQYCTAYVRAALKTERTGVTGVYKGLRG